jgi:hypothetical protein
MQIVIAAVLAFVVLVVLCRLLWARRVAHHTRDGAPMTRERALEILGLGAQASTDDVLTAHRRLIQRLHPDRGGSTYLAQQLNEARDRLLRDG